MRGHDVSGQNAWKTRDLITSGALMSPGLQQKSSCVPTPFAVRGMVQFPNYKMGALTTGQNYDVGDVVADDLTGAFSSDLNRCATELSDSVFVSFLASIPKTRSNTTSDGDLDKIVFQDVILSSTCPACPRILTTLNPSWSHETCIFQATSANVDGLDAVRNTVFV